MKNEQTIEAGCVRTTVMGLVSRAVRPLMLAVAVVGLVLTASSVAAARAHSFKAVVTSLTYVGYHAGYNVFEATGTGTVVGDFSAEAAIHFRHGATIGEGWWTITAANGDVLNLVFEQTGSFETGCWEGPYTIVGGTGRFANASGTGTFVTTSDATGSPVSSTLDGTISF